MRLVVPVLLSFALAAAAAPALEIVKPVISQMEGGAPEPPGFEHRPGETLFFTCRIANFGRTPEMRIHLAYSVQAFDPQGVPLAELYKNEISDELSPQDKEWMPKIETSLAIPPLLPSGTYKIVVKAEDLIAKTNAELSVPFQVRGREVPAADALAVRNFHFFRGEEATAPMEKAVYRSGDGLWARFDIVGFRYGQPNNKIDVSYRISILGAEGKVLWSQPEAASERSESFYPKRYVPASLGLSLQGTKPGEYTMAVSVEDAVGKQTAEARQTFVVEPH
jgi:hypothetical protein